MGGREFEVAARKEGSGLDKFKVAVFTVSCDTAETNKKYAESLKLDYPILSDPDKRVAKAYGVVDDQRPLPARRTYYIGADGKLLYIDAKVNAGKHGTDVAKKLAELKVPKKS